MKDSNFLKILLKDLYDSNKILADDIKKWNRYDDLVLFCNDKEEFIKYKEVSEFVFDEGENFSIYRQPDDWVLNIEEALKPRLTDAGLKRLKSICDRILISSIHYMTLNHVGLENSMKLLQNKADAATEQLKNAQNMFVTESNKVNERINSMYSGFVSVLGIFIAISFSLFGAATLLNDIFTTANKDIGLNIMLAGFATILIYILIIGLLQGVATITKNYYYFSLRKLFVIISIDGGVILCGFIYSHSYFSIKHFSLLIGIVLLYFCICCFIYAMGTPVKKWLISFMKKNIKYR